MAPELIRAPKDADMEADVWALGAILYEFIAGSLPFGESLAAVANILSGKPPTKPVALGNSGQYGAAIDALWSIVVSCLTSDPAGRPKAADVCTLCETLCYSAYEREIGTIARYFIDEKSIGFIRRDGGGDVFFHKDSYYGIKPTVGQRVVFSCFDGGGAPRAHPVVPIG
jgi:eukaryotic-like serine/threonine-protein kinase